MLLDLICFNISQFMKLYALMLGLGVEVKDDNSLTTVKEFEKQKQEIWQNLDKALGYLIDENQQKASILIWDEIKKMQKLQLPRPTCRSCKHYCAGWFSFGVCGNGIKEYEAPAEYEGHSLVNNNFGCNKHSDYDEVKDE